MTTLLATRPRVLVAHEDRDVLAMLGTRLARRGFDVIESDCADDAVAVARLGKADVTVVDGSRPECVGADVCAEIKGTLGLDIPVVMLTQDAHQADIEAAFELGADECVTAPFSVDELSAVLRSAVRERGARSPRPAVGAPAPAQDPPKTSFVRGLLGLACFATAYRLARRAA
jgi:DNA-binding response OmpR family regulator